MASAEDHIDLANRNHNTLAFLISDYRNHSEWVATVAFYKAVQVVEAVFAETAAAHSYGHDSRTDRLKSGRYKGLFKDYRPLFSASLIARYLVDAKSKTLYDTKPPVQSFSNFESYKKPDEVLRMIKKRLGGLESQARSMLSENSRNNLRCVTHIFES